MRIATVFFAMAICFFSLIGVIVFAKMFGFSPEQFHDAKLVFSPSTYLTILAILIVPILIVLLIQKFVHKKPVRDLGLSRLNLKDFAVYATFGIVLKLLATVAAFLCSPDSQISVALSENDLASWTPYFGWFLFTLHLNSFNEELIYRAYPFENLRGKLGPTAIIVLSAAVFSGMHFVIEAPSVERFLYRFFFGTLAGFVYLRHHSLASIVGLHTGWNLVALSVSDSHWKLGGLLKVSGLIDNSEITANIVALAAATAIATRRAK